MLFLGVGGNGGANGNGSIVALDLRSRRVVWQRHYPNGVDGLAVTPDGSRLYVPVGEHTMDDRWRVVDAHTGRVLTDIHAGPGPHNTVVAPDGRRVFLGPRNSRYLYVADTATNRIVRRVGPLLPGVRPFTIDAAERFAYTTATGVTGFQVSSLATGHVVQTVRFRGAMHGNPRGAPSHGIALTPDGRRLFVLDIPNAVVRVYAIGADGRARRLGAVRLRHPLVGRERPCGGDCGRAGWLLASLDGREVYVGDGGDVISASSLRVVHFVRALRDSRYPIEIDWRGDRPIATGGR
jgi:DNA-binding beta-propeller fold protein YncE